MLPGELERRQRLAEDFANTFKLGSVQINVTPDVIQIAVNEEKADNKTKQAIEKLRLQLTHSPLLEDITNINYFKDKNDQSLFAIHYVIHDDWGGKDPIELPDHIRILFLKLASKNPVFIEAETEGYIPAQALLQALMQKPPVTNIVFKGGTNLQLSVEEMQTLYYLICGNEQEGRAANDKLMLIPELVPPANTSEENVAICEDLMNKIARQLFEKNVSSLLQKEGLTAGIAYDVANRRANRGHYFENVSRRPEVTTLVANFLFGEYKAKSEENPVSKSFKDITKRDRFSDTRHFRTVVDEGRHETQESDQQQELQQGNKDPKKKAGPAGP